LSSSSRFSPIRRPLTSPLFPYTTLFRSDREALHGRGPRTRLGAAAPRGALVGVPVRAPGHHRQGRPRRAGGAPGGDPVHADPVRGASAGGGGGGGSGGGRPAGRPCRAGRPLVGGPSGAAPTAPRGRA